MLCLIISILDRITLISELIVGSLEFFFENFTANDICLVLTKCDLFEYDENDADDFKTPELFRDDIIKSLKAKCNLEIKHSILFGKKESDIYKVNNCLLYL
jgi:hypothetical protein